MLSLVLKSTVQWRYKHVKHNRKVTVIRLAKVQYLTFIPCSFPILHGALSVYCIQYTDCIVCGAFTHPTLALCLWSVSSPGYTYEYTCITSIQYIALNESNTNQSLSYFQIAILFGQFGLESLSYCVWWNSNFTTGVFILLHWTSHSLQGWLGTLY